MVTERTKSIKRMIKTMTAVAAAAATKTRREQKRNGNIKKYQILLG